jgi:hypothetical protein
MHSQYRRRMEKSVNLSNMLYVEEREQSYLFQVNMSIPRIKDYTNVYAVAIACLVLKTSLIQKVAGPVLPVQLNLKMSKSR